MEIDIHTSLENALAKTEADADAALKAATAVVSSLKKFRTAAQTGTVRELRKTIDTAEQAITALRQQFTNAKEDWVLDENSYLSSKAFIQEILKAAEQAGLKIFEQDDRLYCYPFLIRILPSEQSILIDKAREKRLRPTVLVKHLKDLQSKPARFKSEAFLESLYSAYKTAVKTRGQELIDNGMVIKLLEIYELLTLLPGQSKEYSRQEFTRDIYLLDQSHVTKTREGLSVTFPASTGTRSTSGIITVITQDGHEKKYYGISFVKE